MKGIEEDDGTNKLDIMILLFWDFTWVDIYSVGINEVSKGKILV
jgi:hypothetical protein